MVVPVYKYWEQSLNCLQAANWLKVYKEKNVLVWDLNIFVDCLLYVLRIVNNFVLL